MTVNIYDSANAIEREIRQVPEYIALQAAFGKIKADPIIFALFKDFQNLQMNLQQKQMQGQEITEAEIQELQEKSQKMNDEELIKDLMQAEEKMSVIINDLNRIIMQPIQELYQD